MQWKKIVVGAASGGAVLAGAVFLGASAVQAILSLSQLQQVVLGAAGIGSGAVGVKVANRGE